MRFCRLHPPNMTPCRPPSAYKDWNVTLVRAWTGRLGRARFALKGPQANRARRPWDENLDP
ncbi:hypothetical protein MCC02031_06150 [Bifidobacteriaceae bacterium MCC02031]|nr:hypothetical protein MCC02031_06150 [Bifidobacteriaceae bacterium MCC02031]GDZ40268.1 hypothetical protein MCC01970_09910 [Bifidobacteriaceae bacterium MCC01970]